MAGSAPQQEAQTSNFQHFGHCDRPDGPNRLEDLRLKLENQGYSNISYIIVNHQGSPSQLKHTHLKNHVSDQIAVYRQEEHQTDVWTLLNGNKDDFLIYDRCGRLVYHLGLPYSFLTFPYVEEAIKIAYCEKKCRNCSFTLLRVKRRSPRRHITTTSTITNTGTGFLGAGRSFQRISSLEQRMLKHLFLL
ncbi:Selenoprotein P [Cricetulus griseus]|uniref:Selenoprotein P n=1 Tax=Cricetulus griseus TaxID=10029 RepID=G3ID68_CRIGR|nr:Selenoprotein P [Cricetulus griseus]